MFLSRVEDGMPSIPSSHIYLKQPLCEIDQAEREWVSRKEALPFISEERTQFLWRASRLPFSLPLKAAASLFSSLQRKLKISEHFFWILLKARTALHFLLFKKLPPFLDWGIELKWHQIVQPSNSITGIPESFNRNYSQFHLGMARTEGQLFGCKVHQQLFSIKTSAVSVLSPCSSILQMQLPSAKQVEFSPLRGWFQLFKWRFHQIACIE